MLLCLLQPSGIVTEYWGPEFSIGSMSNFAEAETSVVLTTFGHLMHANVNT